MSLTSSFSFSCISPLSLSLVHSYARFVSQFTNKKLLRTTCFVAKRRSSRDDYAKQTDPWENLDAALAAESCCCGRGGKKKKYKSGDNRCTHARAEFCTRVTPEKTPPWRAHTVTYVVDLVKLNWQIWSSYLPPFLEWMAPAHTYNAHVCARETQRNCILKDCQILLTRQTKLSGKRPIKHVSCDTLP